MVRSVILHFMSATTYKRTQYLVDRRYQLRFVTRLFMVVLAVASASTLLSAYLLWKNMYVPGEGIHTSFIVALIAVCTTLLVELLLAIPLIFYVGIRQTHRVVGPIKRMERMLDAIGNGDFSQRIHLREGDVLQDVAEAINRMAERLQKRS